MRAAILLGLAMTVCAAECAQGVTRLVPDEYATIQAAIDDCNGGDVVIVAPGTYTGDGNRDIDFLGKAITVRSTDPNDPNVVAATVIDCNGTRDEPHRAFKFYRVEGPDSVLAGLTITRGYGPEDGYISSMTRAVGGAIFCKNSHPTIRYCTVMNNFAENGGAICCDNSSAVFTNCIIRGNTGRYSGGGIYCYYSAPALTNCILADNWSDSGGGMAKNRSYADLTNCILVGNTADWGGGAIYDQLGSFTISNCTITGNSADSGGGIYCSGAENGDPKIDNTILWGNTADAGPQIRCGSSSRFRLIVSYSDVADGQAGAYVEPGKALDWGPGNIDTDPRFVDPSGGDYHLSHYSLCINAGDPCYRPALGAIDIDGEPRVINGRVDIGADEADYEGPFLGISPTKFAFDANEGGRNPWPQILSIRSAGSGTIDWKISHDCNWLNVEPHSGNSAGEIDEVTLTVDVAGLTLGRYNCTLTVLAPGVVNSPQTVVVGLHIRRPTVYVPADFPTIQDAIDDVLEGSTVIVADGVYTGFGNRNIDFKGKAITVRSENGPTSCVIDCQDSLGKGHHRGFIFHSGENYNSVLDGFTIMNGSTTGCRVTQGGGAILCQSSSPTITNCIIRGNRTMGCIVLDSYGGGIALHKSSARISKCTISDNWAYDAGGGIICEEGSPIISNCVIAGNSAEYGAGAAFIESSAIVTNCTFSSNDTSGICCFFYSYVTVTNSIFWANGGPEIWLGTYTPTMTISHSNVEGLTKGVYLDPNSTLDWGPGNIDTDPCFVQPGYWDPDYTPEYPREALWVDGDYHLKSQAGRWDLNTQAWVQDDVASPCIDAGDMASPIGLEPFPSGGVINMGGYGGTREASKSYFGTDVCETIIAGDINGDCRVDSVDLAILTAHWLQDARPPVVYITSPQIGAEIYGLPFEIRAEAWDVDGSVIKVEFFANGRKIGEDSDGSDGWAIDCQEYVSQICKLTARATDNMGMTATSPAVEITLVGRR
jgi:predicted outer membrane repeat protein